MSSSGYVLLEMRSKTGVLGRNGCDRATNRFRDRLARTFGGVSHLADRSSGSRCRRELVQHGGLFVFNTLDPSDVVVHPRGIEIVIELNEPSLKTSCGSPVDDVVDTIVAPDAKTGVECLRLSDPGWTGCLDGADEITNMKLPIGRADEVCEVP